MKRNTKALLWVIAVFAVLSVGLYIGGCGEDEEAADAGVADTGAGNPCDGKKADDACPGGFCVSKVGGTLECLKECTVVGIDSTCGEGEGCYPIGKNKVCAKGGDKKVGEACGVPNDCEVGLTCLEKDGLTCWLVCSKDEDCNGGTCEDTEMGFRVCVAEE